MTTKQSSRHVFGKTILHHLGFQVFWYATLFVCGVAELHYNRTLINWRIVYTIYLDVPPSLLYIWHEPTIKYTIYTHVRPYDSLQFCSWLYEHNGAHVISDLCIPQLKIVLFLPLLQYQIATSIDIRFSPSPKDKTTSRAEEFDDNMDISSDVTKTIEAIAERRPGTRRADVAPPCAEPWYLSLPNTRLRSVADGVPLRE